MKNYKDRASVNFLLFVRFITSSPVDIVRLRESRDLRNVEHDQLNITRPPHRNGPPRHIYIYTLGIERCV